MFIFLVILCYTDNGMTPHCYPFVYDVLKREGAVAQGGSWLHFKTATTTSDMQKCLKLAALP